MSRIGKLPIDMPKTVKASIKDGVITVEGPKGKLTQVLRPEVCVEIAEGKVIVTRKDDEKTSRAFHGLTRQLIHSMIVGTSEGFTKHLTIVGVGYRAEISADKKFLVLTLGYSNPIEYVIPEGIMITCETPNKIAVSGADKQRVGQVSAEIRSLRSPEPYKGKGIKYDTEHVRHKIGKAGKK